MTQIYLNIYVLKLENRRKKKYGCKQTKIYSYIYVKCLVNLLNNV